MYLAATASRNAKSASANYGWNKYLDNTKIIKDFKESLTSLWTFDDSIKEFNIIRITTFSTIKFKFHSIACWCVTGVNLSLYLTRMMVRKHQIHGNIYEGVQKFMKY